jgi:hypothetical protein
MELCTEHEVLDHLYDSQLNRLFQQKLDEDSMESLMEIFRKAMNKSKSLPKAKLYPCLLELCDEQIAKLSTRVTMMANPDTAYRADAQGKGGNGGGGGGSGGSGAAVAAATAGGARDIKAPTLPATKTVEASPVRPLLTQSNAFFARSLTHSFSIVKFS